MTKFIIKVILFAVFAIALALLIVHHSHAGDINMTFIFAHPLVPNYTDLLVLFGALLVTYLLQVFLTNFRVCTPYGAFIVIFGFLLGNTSTHDEVLKLAIQVMTIAPHEVLYVYIPIALFNISFCLDVPIFLKTLPQIVVTGIPVCILTGCIFGIMAKFVIEPSWEISTAILLGVLYSPVYPKSITNILKQQSTRTRQISVLLEGEALFTVVITDITRTLMIGYAMEVTIHWYQFLAVVVRIFTLGLLVGYLCGLWGQYMLRKMYTNKLNIFVVCFSIPIFTYALSKLYFSGCGSISVVVVGVMLGLERTVLVKDIDFFLTEFWEVAGCVLDVVICLTRAMLGGTFISSRMHFNDYILVLAIYLLYYITRFLVFLLFSPVLSRLGYGMDLKNMLVCVWSGLKSPFSLEMVAGLEENGLEEDICDKLFFFMLGLYFLSNVINGSFIDTILDFLGLNEISTARKMNMNSCMRHIFLKREKTIAILKMDRFLSDTNWTMVIEATNMKHPYQMGLDTDADEEFFIGYHFTYCDDCKKEVPQEPTPREMRDMIKEAKMRILKAKKMSYSRQYENGMMSKEGIRILSHAVELAMDSEEVEIRVEDLYNRFTEESCFQRFIKRRVENIDKKKKTKIRAPQTYWRRLCYHLVVSSRTFDKVMLLLIAIHVCLILLTMYYHPSIIFVAVGPPHPAGVDHFLFCTKVFFLAVYAIEFVIRVMAYSWISVCSHGIPRYFKSVWRVIDFIVLIACFLRVYISVMDMIKEQYIGSKDFEADIFRQIVQALLLLRIIRLFRVFEVFYPDLMRYLHKVADKKMASTYELGKSYATGETEVLDMLPYMIDNKKIRDEVQNKIEGDRVYITKLLGVVQKERPWIAITVKTKQAIRTILNGMTEAIKQLKTAGWIDTFEYDKLRVAIEDLYKKVNSIKQVQPSAPKVIFKEVAWMAGDESVIDFLFENVTVKKFDSGEIVFGEGNVADGIYIVVTGLFMITYTPDPNILESLHEYGRLPIVDYLSGTKYEDPAVDYIVSGNCIGELSTLTERSYNCTITAESQSQVYVLSHGVLKRAMELSPDPFIGLESRIWKEVSIRIAAPLLFAVPAYQGLAQDQVKYALERAFVPNLSRYKIFAVTDMIEDILLIEGVIVDFNTREMYIAPCSIPRTVQKLILPTSSLMNIPIDIETKLLIIPAKDVDEYDVMMVAEETCELVAAESTSKCLQHTIQDRIKRKRKRGRRTMRPGDQNSRGGKRTLDNVSLGSSRVTSLGTHPSHYTSDPSTSMYFKSEKSESGSLFMSIEEEEEKEDVELQQAQPQQHFQSAAKRRHSMFFV